MQKHVVYIYVIVSIIIASHAFAWYVRTRPWDHVYISGKALLPIVQVLHTPKWLHAHRTIFTAECYEYTFTVTMNTLQLDLLAVVGAHRLGRLQNRV